jgi:hypothetical protein
VGGRIIPLSRSLLEKLTVPQLVRKFPAFYVPRRFTVFTIARHLSLSWATSIQSMPPHPTSWRSISTLPYHLRLGLPSDFISCRFPHLHPVGASDLPHTCHTPRPSYPPWFDHTDIWRGVQIMKLLTVQFPRVSCYLFLLMSKYLPQHPILEYSHVVFFAKFHIHTKQQVTLVAESV